MSKKAKYKPPVTSRSAMPLAKKGSETLMCPFCMPSHPIYPFTPSSCGTIVEVTAVQTVYHAKYDRTMVCAKCGKGSGDMVKWQNALVHNYDCSPGTMTFAEPPKNSPLAKWVYELPKNSFVKYLMEKAYGRASTLDEVTPQGVRTGNIRGYFFYKPRGKNGKRSKAGA